MNEYKKYLAALEKIKNAENKLLVMITTNGYFDDVKLSECNPCNQCNNELENYPMYIWPVVRQVIEQRCEKCTEQYEWMGRCVEKLAQYERYDERLMPGKGDEEA